MATGQGQVFAGQVGRGDRRAGDPMAAAVWAAQFATRWQSPACAARDLRVDEGRRRAADEGFFQLRGPVAPPGPE